MDTMTESLVRGSHNLDIMRARTNRTIEIIINTYGSLRLWLGDERYFRTTDSEEIWWEFGADIPLTVRCIMHSVSQDRPVIIYTSNEAWRQKGLWQLERKQPPYYPTDFGMNSVSIVYHSLDIFLQEAFARWPSLRAHLEPMISAAELQL